MADTKTCQYDATVGSIDGLLAGELAPRVGFVFESIDPASRAPLKIFIGLDCVSRDLGIGAAADADFARVLDDRGEAGGQGGCILVSGYHASIAGRGPNQSRATTPGQLLVEPGVLIVIDHAQGLATLVDYAGNVPLGDIATLVQNSPPSAIDLDRTSRAPLNWDQNISSAQFVDLACEVIDRVNASATLEGVVLSVRQTGRYPADPIAAYRHLRQIAPSTYMFAVRDGDFAVVGATSLTLLRGTGRQIVAETDGATHRVTPGEPEWVPNDKELSEYDAVVHALEADLEPLVAPGTLRLTVDGECASSSPFPYFRRDAG